MHVTSITNLIEIEATTKKTNHCSTSRFTEIKLIDPCDQLSVTQQLDTIMQTEVISNKDPIFIKQYQQDLKQTCVNLSYHMENTPPIQCVRDALSTYTNNAKETNNIRYPIAITKLAMHFNLKDMQEIIKSSQLQFDHAKNYINNLYLIQIIIKHYNLNYIIQLAEAIIFYCVLHEKSDEALTFCKNLLKYLQVERKILSVPHLQDAISNINKNFDDLRLIELPT